MVSHTDHVVSQLKLRRGSRIRVTGTDMADNTSDINSGPSVLDSIDL